SSTAMDKGPSLKFVNISECEIFLIRYFSREFDDRAFFLPSQFDSLKAVEKSSKASPSWRLPNEYCSRTLEGFVNDCEMEEIIRKLSVANIECGGSGTVSPLTKYFGIVPQFSNDDESDNIRSKMKLCVDLLLCLLSLAIDYRDVWSVSRFFGRVCAQALPALRKRSEQTDGSLNITSVLISYVMTSSLEGNHGDDPILSANFSTIKSFTETIMKMTDLLQGDLSPDVAVHQSIKVAMSYLRSVKCLVDDLNELSKVQTFVNKHLAEVEANFTTLSTLASNNYQNMSIYTEKHILAFALRDRLVCLGCITDIGAASPLFKSPAVTSAAACTQSPLEKSSINDEAQHTPSTVSQNRRSRFLPFIDFDTPESGGVVITTVGALNPRIVENVRGDDKENLDVDAIVMLEGYKKKQHTPIRPKAKNARLRLRSMNRECGKAIICEKNEGSLMNAAGGGENSGHAVVNGKRMPDASCKLKFRTTETKNPRKVNGKGKMTKLSSGQTRLTAFFGTGCNSK
uniref:Uncharacterized protein n=1 Tax=Parascaris univalens TaxID=6257 RepID=A0A915BZD6_PARUN